MSKQRGAWISRRGQADAEAAIDQVIDRQPQVDPVAVAALLTNYAVALRKTHRHREARSIEARADAVRAHIVGNALVDVSELSAESNLRK